MISVDTATHLLDFRSGGRISERVARAQLEGAVALHNILQKHQIGYLADEVGMGKTYVALGVLALFRHFQPNFRVLIIAPRGNIQKKWKKELENFVSNNVRFPDLRVKALHGAPARSVVLPESLLDLVTQTTLDPDRDFIVRMPSFSLALGSDEENAEAVGQKAADWMKVLPWIDRSAFGRGGKRDFKDAVARVACCALPVFDLVIVDEAHNLKAGLHERVAARNRVLAFAMGHPEGATDLRTFKGYGPRAKKVLFLSATPIEDEYRQLWNQLYVFDKHHGAPELSGDDAESRATDRDLRRDAARRFLVRRVATIEAGGAQLTKNLYRREWRRGGVEVHDEPIPPPRDARARLAVALVQKKVAEVIGAKRFGNQFQIGMLASFESFLETARVGAKAGEASNFDQVEQTEDELEREGVDVSSLNQIAKTYRRTFNAELPHPKMDAIVEALSSTFDTGEKALIFVRRIASVKELQRKLEDRYDTWLAGRLSRELAPELWERVRDEFDVYRRKRVELRDRLHGQEQGLDDSSGLDTFFSYFFRGETPTKILSGAMVARRLSSASGIHSTFFEDNYIAVVLGVPPAAAFEALARAVRMSAEALTAELHRRAAGELGQKLERARAFRAYQQAAVELLSERSTESAVRDRAEAIRRLRYSQPLTGKRPSRVETDPREWIELSTFWTDLRSRQAVARHLWPSPRGASFAEQLREQEIRREILSSMARLGQPLIDLYVLLVNSLGRVDVRARDSEDAAGNLSMRFLDLLEGQIDRPGMTSLKELSLAAQNLDLILDTNAPALRTALLDDVTKELGRLLRNQMPVGGMFGQVNETLVKQFRMPGYPLVMITTDLLQEGEDLHTFCSRVFHYGISWMPSSMEQRVGRVDRVNSAAERRLTAANGSVTPDDKLQVYYPYLQETVEVLQVNTVLERLDTFMRLMHEDLAAPQTGSNKVDVPEAILRGTRAHRVHTAPLKSAFEVDPKVLAAPRRDLAQNHRAASELAARFSALSQGLPGLEIEWEANPPAGMLLGTARVVNRQQPFTLLSRSFHGHLLVRCVSPVGAIRGEWRFEEVAVTGRGHAVRITSRFDERFSQYDLAVEEDLVLGSRLHDSELAAHLVRRVTAAADQIERELLKVDEPMTAFETDIKEEPRVAR